jgi:hypothetical protein
MKIGLKADFARRPAKVQDAVGGPAGDTATQVRGKVNHAARASAAGLWARY